MNMTITSPRFWLTSSCLFAILFCGLSAPLSAAAVLPDTVYRLLDHPDGALSPAKKYGLRYDHAPDGVGGTTQRVFSFELGTANVRAFWKTNAALNPLGLQPVGTLRIKGDVYDNATGLIWDLVYTATNCFAVAGPGLGGVDCTSPEGPVLGTVTRAGSPTIDLFAKSNGTHTFRLVGDGHRRTGHEAIIGPNDEIGRGWVNPVGTPCCDDFLFRAKVPEPSSLLLLGSGLVGGIVLLRRRFGA